MNSQKKLTKSDTNAATSNNNTNSFTRKPRRSIKAEGNCLNGMLREGLAHVIDASKLGKRLSSEIWNSFGAIRVQDNFINPSIDTKVVADGSSTVKICQFFVACSKCFSVFKYDGHAYGTTGLVKHVKICQGTNLKGTNAHNSTIPTATTTANSGFIGNKHDFDQNAIIDTTQTSTSVLVNNSNTTAPTFTTSMNGPLSTPRRRREPSNNRSRAAQPSLRYLAKVIEELKSEQVELKQKVQEMINLMNASSYVGQIQIISNDGDKVEEELQKDDQL